MCFPLHKVHKEKTKRKVYIFTWSKYPKEHERRKQNYKNTLIEDNGCLHQSW